MRVKYPEPTSKRWLLNSVTVSKLRRASIALLVVRLSRSLTCLRTSAAICVQQIGSDLSKFQHTVLYLTEGI